MKERMSFLSNTCLKMAERIISGDNYYHYIQTTFKTWITYSTVRLQF